MTFLSGKGLMQKGIDGLELPDLVFLVLFFLSYWEG